MKLRRLPGRFEWKILAALFIVAALPLGAAAYLVSVDDRPHPGRHRTAPGGGAGNRWAARVEVYRSYFAEMKENFRDRADEIAAARITRAAELADVPDLLRARILEGDGVVDEWAQPRGGAGARARGAAHAWSPLAGGSPERAASRASLELTFGISREIYANFLALREATEKEHDLDRVLPLVLPRIFRGLLLRAGRRARRSRPCSGCCVARRATGRVATLRDAARRVGEGDLERAGRAARQRRARRAGPRLRRMVAELGDARSRLGYLQKVSAWQEVARRLAHEIKNPLTPIQLAVQELASKYRGDDPAYRAPAGDRAGDPERGGRRHPPPGRRLLGVRQAAQGRAGAASISAQVVEDFARAHPEWQRRA